LEGKLLIGKGNHHQIAHLQRLLFKK